MGSNASDRQQQIRALFDQYIELYASRDERLSSHFSANFSGYTGSGDFLVNDLGAWQKITRQDFAQVPERIRIEMLDLLLQDLSPEVVVATALLRIHLPHGGESLAKEAVRLVLIFRLEDDAWKIVQERNLKWEEQDREWKRWSADGSASSASTAPALHQARAWPAAVLPPWKGLRHETPHQGPHLPDLGLVPPLSARAGPRHCLR